MVPDSGEKDIKKLSTTYFGASNYFQPQELLDFVSWLLPLVVSSVLVVALLFHSLMVIISPQ